MVSFDASIALLGGYAALVWQVIGLLVGWYQDFSYNNSLALQLYMKDKPRGKTESDEGIQAKIESALLNRMPHNYCMLSAVKSILMQGFCCCMKGKGWY